ncbi:RHS repeat-associated core domain-containing protein, partial [Massilia genomosp. 1]
KTKNSNGQDTVAYYHHDQRWAPLQATDRAGNIVWAASYDAFGQAQITSPAAGGAQPTIVSNLRLPGQIEDAETGLHYNYYRDYDPQVGRYIESDPLGLSGGINTYGYVHGNPISRYDPLGLEDASTIACDGKGNYEIINNAKGVARKCVNIHEQSHMSDWIKRYGKDSCVGRPKGYIPYASVNGDDYRDFLRDSECRAYTAEKACTEECKDGGESKKRYDYGIAKNYCKNYDTWKKY